MSIRLRLTLWYAGLVGLVLILLAGLVYVVVSRQLTSQLDYAIHLQALDALRSLHTVSLAQPERRPQRLQLTATDTFTERQLYVQLVDLGGRVLAASPNLRQPLPTPHLAVHRVLSAGLLAVLAVWHNHRVFSRGTHRGASPLQLSGMAEAASDWLVALGYAPAQPALRPAAASAVLPQLAMAA